MAYYCNRCGRRLRSADDQCKYCNSDIPLAVDYEPDDPAKQAALDAVVAADVPSDAPIADESAELKAAIGEMQAKAEPKPAEPSAGFAMATAEFEPVDSSDALGEQDIEVVSSAADIEQIESFGDDISDPDSPPPLDDELMGVFSGDGQDDDDPGDAPSFKKPRKAKNAGSRNNKLWRVLAISAGALLVVAVAVVALLGGFRDPVSREYLAYLEGDWLSENFMYNGDANAKRMVEFLSVDGKGNFTMKYYHPDDEHPDGYKDGSWPVEYELSGTIKIEVVDDTKVMHMTYVEDEKTYYYERHFITKDDDLMSLREYYKDTSFDMVFHRVGAPTT